MPEVDSSLYDSLPNIEHKKNNLSKLLIHESPLQILPSLAALIGLNEAIVLQQIHYWICSSLNKNVVNGRKWVYNTYEDWNKQFPFWGQRTIRVIISSLKEKRLIATGTFNKIARDRTTWYTINYDVLNCLDIGNYNDQSRSHVADPATCIYPNLPHASGRSCHMYDVADPATCNTRDYLPEITKEHKVRFLNFEKEFEEFWEGYDKKADKKKCEKAYAKLLNDKGVDLHEKIMDAISAQKKSREVSDSLGIWQPCRKQALTWLNGNCWEDEVKTKEQLNAEHKRIVSKISNKPMGMSTLDQYHIINDKIRESAEAELIRNKRAEARERGEDWEWDGSPSSLGIPDF